MKLFADIDTQIALIRALLGDAMEVSVLPSVVNQLDDTDAILLLERASELGQLAERLGTTAAGVVAQRAEAARQVRVGEALINGELGGVGISGPGNGGSSGANGVDGKAGFDGAGAP
ncbi:hypothetical protein G7066_07105 [Leucobacter coleopterorum]|uniref:Uncharacterized protein n=1 Tax=Leucobacter coleopterorum TaxID=2714933 RepID=A0ABX6K090_9MICO|nr:hypothetical protein [Leucobacter coleopterorum]QIM18455.1 hypothetical protein G7066_07105 [Leucobacter coleopterorum]